jgi:hypothetical protein
MAACLKAGFNPRLGQEAPRITSALSSLSVLVDLDTLADFRLMAFSDPR